MKRRVGAPEKRPLADFLSTIAIKAKDLAAEMTSVNVQQKDLHGQVAIEWEHIDNNSAVCNMLLNRGIRPEALPPEEDVKKVERHLKVDEKKILPPQKVRGNNPQRKRRPFGLMCQLYSLLPTRKQHPTLNKQPQTQK